MKKIFFITILVITAIYVYPQSMKWYGVLGSEGTETLQDAVKDAYGNIIVAGEAGGSFDADFSLKDSIINFGASQGFLARYKPDKTLCWAFNCGGIPSSIATDDTGNIYIAGIFDGIQDFDPGPGNRMLMAFNTKDIFIAKYSTSGKLVWAYNVADDGSVFWNTPKLILDKEGAIYLFAPCSGYTDLDLGLSTNYLNANANDIYLAKYSNDCKLQFGFSLGGTGLDKPHGIGISNKTVVITGEIISSIDFDPGPAQYLMGTATWTSFLARYTLDGKFKNGFTLSGSVPQNFITNPIIDPDENIYFSGYYQGTIDMDPSPGTCNFTSLGWVDTYIASYDSTLKFKWAGTMGGSTWDRPSRIASDLSNNIYITGDNQGITDMDPGPGKFNVGVGVFVAKVSNKGVFQWANSFLGVKGTISVDKQGEILLGYGYSTQTNPDPANPGKFIPSVGNNDILLATYNSYAPYTAGHIGGLNNDKFICTHVLNGGNYLVSGTFTGTADLNYTSVVNSVTTPGPEDAFISKYNTFDKEIWTKTFTVDPVGSSRFLYIDNIFSDIDANIYISGMFAGSWDADPSVGTKILSSTDGGSFFAKYDNLMNLKWAIALDGTITDNKSVKSYLFNNKNIYLGGTLDGTVDFDPSPGVYNVTGSKDMFIARYDTNGTLIKVLSTDPAGALTRFYALYVDSSENIYITCDSKGDEDFDLTAGVKKFGISAPSCFFIKYNKNGNIIWGGIMVTTLLSHNFTSIMPLQNNKILLSGFYKGDLNFDIQGGSQIFTSTNKQVFFAEYDTTGKFINVRFMSNNGTSGLNQVKMDNAGFIYACGSFTGNVNFAFSGSDHIITANGTDGYIAKYDSSYNLIWIKKTGDIYSDNVLSVDIDPSSNVISVGSFYGIVNMDVYGGSNAVESFGMQDGFLIKFNQYPEISTQPQNISVCQEAGAVFSINSKTLGTSQYIWKKDGKILAGGTSTAYTISSVDSADQGMYSCEIALGDKKTESFAARLTTKYKPKSGLQIQNEICKNNSAPLVYTGDSIGTTQHWELSGGTITSETGLSKKTVLWNTGGKKTISVYSEIDECSSDISTDSVTVKEAYNAEKICMVTVDSATGKNKIIWEKTSEKNTQSFNIYKVFGVVYQPIGNVPYNDLTVFKDFTSIPESMVDRYAISAIDSCGNESAKSPFHQTMLLQAAKGTAPNEAVLNWNKYIDESGDWKPEYYYIYKGKTRSTMMLIDSVSALLETRYNDQKFDGVSAYYQCFIVKKTPCSPAILKAESGPYTQSLSNIVEFKTGSSLGAGNELTVSAFPNPFSENIYLDFSLEQNSDVLIEVINTTGQKTTEFSYKNLAAGKQQIQINAAAMNISEGMCYVKIVANEKTSVVKCNYIK